MILPIPLLWVLLIWSPLVSAQSASQYSDQSGVFGLNHNLRVNFSTPLTSIGNGVALWCVTHLLTHSLNWVAHTLTAGLLTGLLTQLDYSHTHWLTHWLTHTRILTHSINQSLTQSLTHSITHSITYDITRSDYAAVSASHMVANYNTFRSHGIVYLYKRNAAPTSVLDSWLDTGSRFASNVGDDGYGSCISMTNNVMVVGAPTDSQNGEKNGLGTSCLYNVYWFV
jgi:hypothetical protein